MGVLACDRKGCDNIMCGRYNDELGYICDECYAELVATNTHPAIFMVSRKENNKWYDYESIFVSRYR